MTIFDAASLNAAVTNTLAAAQVPADHTHAFALVATMDGTVKAVLSTKIDTVWQVDAVLDYQHNTGISGGVQIKATW